jgi:hypothetical protein
VIFQVFLNWSLIRINQIILVILFMVSKLFQTVQPAPFLTPDQPLLKLKCNAMCNQNSGVQQIEVVAIIETQARDGVFSLLKGIAC